MLKNFRLTGYAEGLSLLALFFIAMPLKYVWGEPMAVRIIGWIHGLLFIAYVVMANQLGTDLKWPKKLFFWAFVAAVLPFGTFVFDRTVLKRFETPAA